MAAAILAVGATSVLAAYSTTMGLIEHQRRLSDAVNVTSSKLEELLMAAPGSPQMGGGTTIVNGLGRAPDLGEIATYEVRWTVNQGVPRPGYMEVIVETSWVEMRGPRFTRFAAYR